MRSVVIGLDGLEPDLVERWEEHLPTIRTLMQQGSFGRLRSSDPPLSSPAWQWMFTGKQGGKHGCFGFTRRKKGSYERVPINLSDVNAETLWEVLDAEGVSCGVVNVPETYPPTELEHGFMISGWPTPNRVNPGDPPEIVTEIEGVMGHRYRVNPIPMGPELTQFPSDRVFEELKSAIWHHEHAFETLLSLREVDVFFCAFTATDVAGHYLASDEPLLRDTYIEQDRALGQLLDNVQPDVNVIVFSDHGHAAKGELNFHIVEWLRRHGYFELETDSHRGAVPAIKRVLRRTGFTRENVLAAKNQLGIGDIRDIVPHRVFQSAQALIPAADEREESISPDEVDWDNTVAYVGSEQNVVFLNTTFAHPQGTVTENEVDELRMEIKEKLLSIDHPNPDRNDGLVSELKTKDEIFEGPFEAEAPDIVFVTDEMRCKVHTGLNDGELYSDNDMGEHRQWGILVTAGPMFANQQVARDRSILDVFPLVLALSRTAIPENIDGTVPTERLEEPIEVTYRESRDTTRDTRSYSREESAAIEEQLRGLGYLK